MPTDDISTLAPTDTQTSEESVPRSVKKRATKPSLTLIDGDNSTLPLALQGTVMPSSRARSLTEGSLPSHQTFTLLDKWDGIVIAVNPGEFTARLFPSADPTHVFQAVFSNEELSSDECGQIEEGAPFVWTIGYRHIGSTRHRDSTIYFRRLPPWEPKEINDAKNRAGELSKAIDWH